MVSKGMVIEFPDFLPTVVIMQMGFPSKLPRDLKPNLLNSNLCSFVKTLIMGFNSLKLFISKIIQKILTFIVYEIKKAYKIKDHLLFSQLVLTFFIR